MWGTIELSERSLELISKYVRACNLPLCSLQSSSSSVEFTKAVAWLRHESIPTTITDKKKKKHAEFILSSLRAELLRDLFLAMEGVITREKKIEEKPSFENKMKLILLAIAGAFLAACQGFDSIIALMGFLAAPSLAILAVGLGFSLLSVVVFYGFELVQVSNNLGIKLKDAPKLLDVYLTQLEEVNAIKKKMNTYNLATKSIEELDQLEQLTSMLQIRVLELNHASKQFELALNSSKMQIAKHVVTGGAGLLFFSGGFLAGQSVSMFLLGFFFTTVSATFWPVILFSLIVGAAALCVYWYVERVGVTQLISSWFGLDEEKIEELCDEAHLVQEEKELGILKQNIKSCSELIGQVTELQQQATKPGSTLRRTKSESNPGSSMYSFHALKPKPIEANSSELSPEELLESTLCCS